MAASLTDKFRKTVAFFATSLTSSISATDTSFTFDSTTDVPTDTAVDMVFDRVDSDGNKLDSSLREVATGTVSGSTFTTALGNRGLDGTVTQSHSAGAVVEGNMTAAMWNDMVDGILVSHNQDGTQADNSVITAAIQDNAVTSAKIASEAWTSFTPVWTGSSTNPTVGNGTLVGSYMKIGRTVHFRIFLTFGSTSTKGSGVYAFSLPVTPASHSISLPVGTLILDDGTSTYFGIVQKRASTQVFAPSQISGLFASNPSIPSQSGETGSTTTSWPANSHISLTGTYESAS